MNVKKQARLRRARRTRAKISQLNVTRLCVYRTPRHIYAQIISASGAEVLAAASTLDQSLRGTVTGNVAAATKIGAMIAERAKAADVSKVAFDRAGYNYHGRIKALADAAREGGLDF